MPATVYLETSVISYMTSPMSRDLQVGAHQQATTPWWDREQLLYTVIFTPEELLEEQPDVG